jgi:hypothetical protein
LIATRAEQASALLGARPGASALPAPVLPPHGLSLTWRNWLFTLPGLRRAHVELFAVAGQFSVLHICLMPSLTRAEPIFGLDLVGGRSFATGVFLDLSPTSPTETVTQARRILAARGNSAFGEARPLPDWGAIFSRDFICVRPLSLTDAEASLDHGFTVMLAYLDEIAAAPDSVAASAELRAAQSAYCRGQRENHHTRRMLTGFVGAAQADVFIDTVLFPPAD